ncbi:MAG TPA: hypothetical protein VNH11_15980 [Pirellulales bacterium]|nr:hypothetical protein [Pirellulales bacterium]
MDHDLLEQLAGTAVPPPPDEFDRSVHQRLNRTLVVGQLVEFVAVALPWALAEFARALAAAALYTSSGSFPPTPTKTQD